MFKVELITRRTTLSFVADNKRSLMECAEDEEIRILSSCRNGTCRTCITKALVGSFRYEMQWPGLSAEERAEGFVLPCVAIACTDLRIENLDAYLI